MPFIQPGSGDGFSCQSLGLELELEDDELDQELALPASALGPLR